MTDIELRDHLAGQAIAGAAVGLYSGIHGREGLAAEISAAAYKLADAMLAERQKGLTALQVASEGLKKPGRTGLPTSGQG
jgi:hypothetical protein